MTALFFSGYTSSLNVITYTQFTSVPHPSLGLSRVRHFKGSLATFLELDRGISVGLILQSSL